VLFSRPRCLYVWDILVKSKDITNKVAINIMIVFYLPSAIVEDDWLTCFDKWSDGLKCSKSICQRHGFDPIQFMFDSNSTHPANVKILLMNFMTPNVKLCASILLIDINEIKKHIDGVARLVF